MRNRLQLIKYLKYRYPYGDYKNKSWKTLNEEYLKYRLEIKRINVWIKNSELSPQSSGVK